MSLHCLGHTVQGPSCHLQLLKISLLRWEPCSAEGRNMVSTLFLFSLPPLHSLASGSKPWGEENLEDRPVLIGLWVFALTGLTNSYGALLWIFQRYPIGPLSPTALLSKGTSLFKWSSAPLSWPLGIQQSLSSIFLLRSPRPFSPHIDLFLW